MIRFPVAAAAAEKFSFPIRPNFLPPSLWLRCVKIGVVLFAAEADRPVRRNHARPPGLAIGGRHALFLPVAKHAGQAIRIHLLLRLICGVKAVRDQLYMATYAIEVTNFKSEVIFEL